MTSKIYIRGDIGGPSVDLEVYDADTMQRLLDVVFMDITIGMGTNTEATLTYRGGGKSPDVVDIVPDPVNTCFKPKGGAEFDIKLYEDRLYGASETRVTAELRRRGAVATNCSRIVSDQEQAKAIYDALQMGREDVLRKLLEPVIQDLAKKQPPATGGVVTSRTNNAFANNSNYGGFPPKLDYDALDPFKRGEVKTHRPPCPECGGKGEVELFNGTVPCSTCVPKIDPMAKLGTKLINYWKDGQLYYGDDLFGKVINCRCTLTAAEEPVTKKTIEDAAATIAHIQAGAAEQNILDLLKRNSEKVRDAIIGRNPCAEIDLGYVYEDEMGYTPGATGEFIADKVFPKHKKSECPDCNGTGSVELFTSNEPCSTCCD